MQTAHNATVGFRLTSVLHVGPVMALPNTPPVDDHSTQSQLSNVGFTTVVGVIRVFWAVWSQELLQIQLLAILDSTTDFDCLHALTGVLTEPFQRQDEGVWDGVDAQPLVGHLVPATMERHVGLCL